MTSLSESSLLLSQWDRRAFDDPFFFFEVADFLLQELYDALRGSFPEERWFPELIQGDKKRLNSWRRPEHFEKFCGAHPIWKEIFDFFRSEEFLEDLFTLVWRRLR